MTLQREIKIGAIQTGYKSNRVEFFLHGQQGTVQFVFMTDLAEGLEALSVTPSWSMDVGYHWDKKRYKGQYKMKSCTVREQGYCFYDGSSLVASEWFKILREQGSDAIWPLMEQYYKEMLQESVEV